MRKPLLIIAAIALLVFYTYGFVQWLQSGHRFSDVWLAATSDWFLAVTVLDLSLFALLCSIWLYRDMQGRNFSAASQFFILLATLIAGFVVLLFYLAFRKDNIQQKER